MSNPNMANLPPKPSLDAPISPNQQQSLVHHQPNFAHSQTNFPPNQMHHVPRQPIFAQSQSNFSLNQPNFARPQPNFARSQPKFPHNQFPHNQFPHNQPNLAHRQPSFAHRQPNFPSTQPNRPSPSELPPHGQQQHLSPSNQIVLRGHPQSLDQSLISDPSLPHYPTSTNSYHFPPSSYPPLSPNSFSRILPPASRPAHSNHPQFSNQHQQQHQQQQHHSRTSSQDSLLTCNPSLMRVPQIVPAGANRRVTFSTSAADAARRQGAMQDNFTPANEDGPSSFNSNREIHNAIRQVHETLNVMRNEMVAMHEQVHQNMYTLHRETHAMHESNNGSIERVIKMLNYSERNNLARTMNSTITSQSQFLEPLLTSDGVRPVDFPVNLLALNNLDIHQVTALCELYSLGLTGGMEQKMQRLRMFIGIERA